MALDLAGIHMMMPTPFDENRELLEEDLPLLLDLAANAGCKGVVCLGEMGEHARLTEDERRRIVRTVVEHSKGRLTVTVGATGQSTHLAVQNAAQSLELGADAVMVAPPTVRKTNLDGVFAYYKAINEVPITLVIQDFPEVNNVFMPPPFIARLHKELEQARYLKLEEPPTPPKITAVKAAAGDSMGIFGGLGGVYLLEELTRGACGTMTGYAYPEVLVEIYRNVVEGDEERAREVFYRNVPLIRYEAQAGISLSIRKEIFKHRGALQTAAVRPPGPEIDDTTRKELQRTLESLGLG